MIIFSCLYLLTSAFCPVRSVDHWQQSTSVPLLDVFNCGLSSPAPSSSDRFSAFLPRCLCAMWSWVLPSLSSPVESRSEPGWWCCWQASWGRVSAPCVPWFPSFSSLVESRSGPAWWCCWQASWGRVSAPCVPWFPSFSSSVNSRSKPAWRCCWQASWGCGQSNPGSSPLPLPLWIPDQSLPGDVAGRLPEDESLPHVFLGSPLSLPLWSPGQSLADDVAGRLPEGVANPTLGLLLFLFPCGVQVRACLVLSLAGFLRVWPIQPWVFPSLSSSVESRSEPAWWCCWQASWGVASPAPLSSADLCVHWFLICCLPLVLVSYLLLPLDTEDFAQTAVDESLELMECCLSRSPCLRSVEE